MRFNVLVTGIDNSRSKTIVAHNLAGNRSVSLQHALSLLENLPVIYQVNLLKEEAEATIARLGKIGVKAGAVPVEIGENAVRENKIKEAAAVNPETVPRQPAETIRAPQPNFTYISGEKSAIGPPEKAGRKKLRIAAIVIAACFIGSSFSFPIHRLRIRSPAYQNKSRAC
jgi:isopentenyl diphosphate isomerase/L-lactate dehydrogenase-like FMN-dependent dehydrogenase